MAFTEADRRRLEALKEKERKAKQAERNEQKRVDAVCKKMFGMTAKEVKSRLEIPDYQTSYDDLKLLVERLMHSMGKVFEEFPQYVEWREQKAAERTR